MDNIVIFAISATAWDFRKNIAARGYDKEIIEIAAIKTNSDIDRLDEFQTFVKPLEHKKISSFCQRFTGITQFDVNDAPLIKKAIEKFSDWLDPDPIICSYGTMYINTFSKACKKARFGDPFSRVINAKKRIATSLKWRSERGLEKAMLSCGLKFHGRRNRAPNEAFNLYNLLYYLKYRKRINIIGGI